MQSVQAHLQYLLRDLSKQQQQRGTCPIGEAFLGKQETKGWKHHLELLSGEERAKPQLKSVRQGYVSELYPVYCHQPRTQECPALAAMLQPRLHHCFTVSGFSNFSVNFSNFVQKGFLAFFSNSMQAFFFNLPLAQSISYMNHNREGWEKERGQVSQFLIDIY